MNSCFCFSFCFSAGTLTAPPLGVAHALFTTEVLR
jgi:hypothetical protein